MNVPTTDQQKNDERAFALDYQILRTRGEAEPRESSTDIRSVDALVASMEISPFVKFTRDGGETWRYAKLSYGFSYQKEGREVPNFSNGGPGLHANWEVLPNAGIHQSRAFTKKDFEEGLLVRPATPEELTGIKFSYE